MTLTPNELKRYARQITLSSIGIEGQLKLKQARVLCVGAGGLGTPLLLYLAAAGVGTIGIVEDDQIDMSNLPRQILYHDEHIGRSKGEVAQQQLRLINPHLTLQTYFTRLDVHNALDIIHSYDIVADCSDNFFTRYVVNDSCFKAQKPYVTASISKFEGQCAMFLGTQGPCLRCLFPVPPSEDSLLNCEEGGVLGVLPGLLGMIQATEIMKWILQLGELLVGKVLMVNALRMQFREFQLSPNPDCEGCAHYRMMEPVNVPYADLRSQKKMNEYTISVEELKEALERNEDIQLIDVRTPEKHQAFNIGGKLIPLDDLGQHLHEVDANKLIVTYCTSGGRSMRALQFLLDAGFTSVKSLEGGMTAWQEEIVGKVEKV